MSKTTQPRMYKLNATGLYLNEVLLEKPGAADLRALAQSTALSISTLIGQLFPDDTVELRFNAAGALELVESEVSPAAQYLNLAQRLDDDKQSLQIVIAWCVLCTLAISLVPPTEQTKAVAQAFFIATAKWHLAPGDDDLGATVGDNSEVLMLPWPSGLSRLQNITPALIARATNCEIHLSNDGELRAFFPIRHGMQLADDPLWRSHIPTFNTNVARFDALIETPDTGPLNFKVSSILGGDTVFKLNTALSNPVDLFEGLAGYEYQARHGNNLDRAKPSNTDNDPGTTGAGKTSAT